VVHSTEHQHHNIDHLNTVTPTTVNNVNIRGTVRPDCIGSPGSGLVNGGFFWDIKKYFI
jgi:hypothetical protein